MLPTERYFEIFPIHDEIALISETFAMNLWISKTLILIYSYQLHCNAG